MSFTIQSAEGLPIRGELDVPPKPRALAVIVHGFKGFKDWGFFPWLAEALCQHRIAVCRFNMSRSGIGENPESFDRLDLFADDTYSTQVSDLMDVVAFARRQVRAPLFLLGHSRGGGVAMLAAPEIRDLKGIVTWSAISRADRWDDATKQQWRRDGHMDIVNARTNQVMRMSTRILDDYEKHHERLDILKAASRISVPTVTIHGARDESVPVAESYEIASRIADGAHLVVGNATHTYNAIHPLVHVPKELRYAALVSAQFIVVHS